MTKFNNSSIPFLNLKLKDLVKPLSSTLILDSTKTHLASNESSRPISCNIYTITKAHTHIDMNHVLSD